MHASCKEKIEEALKPYMDKIDQLTEDRDHWYRLASIQRKEVERLEDELRLLLETIERAATPTEKIAAGLETTVDNVNSPPHYTTGGIETIDFIQAKLTPEEFAGYCKGNTLKYVSRSNMKGGIESLQKANWYLNRLLGDRRAEG